MNAFLAVFFGVPLVAALILCVCWLVVFLAGHFGAWIVPLVIWTLIALFIAGLVEKGKTDYM